MKKSILTVCITLIILTLTSCSALGVTGGFSLSSLWGGGSTTGTATDPVPKEESVYSSYDFSVKEAVDQITPIIKSAGVEDIFQGIYQETSLDQGGQIFKEHRYRDGETRFSLYIVENASEKKVLSVRVEQPYGSDEKIFLDYQKILIQGVAGLKDVDVQNEILSSNDYVALKAKALGFGQETVHYGKSYFKYSSNEGGRRVYEVRGVKTEEKDYQPTTFYDGKTHHYFYDKDNYNRPRPYTEEDLVALLYQEFLNPEKTVSKEMLDAFNEEKQEDILALEGQYLGQVAPVAGEEEEAVDTPAAPPLEPPEEADKSLS